MGGPGFCGLRGDGVRNSILKQTGGWCFAGFGCAHRICASPLPIAHPLLLPIVCPSLLQIAAASAHRHRLLAMADCLPTYPILLVIWPGILGHKFYRHLGIPKTWPLSDPANPPPYHCGFLGLNRSAVLRLLPVFTFLGLAIARSCFFALKRQSSCQKRPTTFFQSFPIVSQKA